MKKRKPVVILLFVLYSLTMLWLLFGQRIEYISSEPYNQQLMNNYNLEPFSTFWLFYDLTLNFQNDLSLSAFAFVNLVGNVVMFIPLGIFPPYLCKKLNNFFAYILFIFLLILSIELLQWVTLLGRFDVDDIILNVIGGLIGFVSFSIFKAVRKNKVM